MKKTIRNISLMLLLVLSIIPLSGCSRRSAGKESTKTMDNAFEALSELKIESKEVEYSDEYIEALTKDYDESTKEAFKAEVKEEKTYQITISNPTDHYYNYAPVGFVFDKEKLTENDLASKDYTMVLLPITLAPDDENVFYLTPQKEDLIGEEITLVPYFLPFGSSAIASTVKDPYKSGSSKDDSSSSDDKDSKDKKDDSNKDKKDNDKNKDKSASLTGPTTIKSDSKKEDNSKSKDDSKDSDSKQTRDQKYISAYISDDKSSEVVYPGEVEFGEPYKEFEQDKAGMKAGKYSVEITNNSDATLKVSSGVNEANGVMFGMLIVDGEKINAITMTTPDSPLTLKPEESGEVMCMTIGATLTEPKIIFNGYGPARGAGSSDSKDDSKNNDKDNSKDSDKNKDKDKKSK